MATAPPKSLPRWAKRLGYLVFFVAVGALVWTQLPRGAYPTDLGRIGSGRPALVLAYDINSLGGMTVMKLMDELRGEYADRVEFLVADLGVPAGQAFAQRHGANSGTVVMLSDTGSHLRTLHLPANSQVLREALDAALPQRMGSY